jgi:hypothetical protein
VCRQFYSETIAALYASTTFVFHEPQSFRTFALSSHTHVKKLQYLTIPRLGRKWENTITASTVGRLKNLRGVRLSYDYYRRTEAQRLPNPSSSELKGLWRVIRAFQQHELEAGHTLLELTVYNSYLGTHENVYGHFGSQDLRLKPGEPQYDDKARLQKQLTEGLLQYTARRLSKRGAA